MECVNCGNQLQPTDTFCGHCGAPVGGAQTNYQAGQQNMNFNMGAEPKKQENELLKKAKGFFGKVSEKQNRTALVAAIVMFVSMFLTYAKVSFLGYSESINYMSTDDGKIVIVLLILAIAAYYLKRDNIGLVISAVIFIITLMDWSTVDDLVSSSAGLGKAGIGCYLGILASLAMTIAPFIGDKVEALFKKN